MGLPVTVTMTILYLILATTGGGWFSIVPAAATSSSFKAAVWEHKPYYVDNSKKVLSRQEALHYMLKNLLIYEDQAKKAKKQGAEIIVFPEYGIFGYGVYGTTFTRKTLPPFLEQIPDPETISSWSPCSDPGRFKNSEVQHKLSCIAQENDIYLVANMADKVPCRKKTDPKCPTVGHYQYNTNVAYSPNGTLVAKYHKVHLFQEDYFDAAKAKVSSFSTPFAGKIGLIICADLMYGDPLIAMVTDHNITTIAYPTDFVDFLPYLTAIGFHSSVARGLGVNILSANLHDAENRAYGSGIYTPKGARVFYYNDRKSSEGKLLVSSVEPLQEPDKIMINRDFGTENDDKNNEIIGNEDKGAPFDIDVFGDTFTFKLLENLSGRVKVCQKKVCCSVDYIGDYNQTQDLFALGVFDGLHTYIKQYYQQVCTLVRCADSKNMSTCGSPTKISTTKFKSLSLKGNFEAKYVYPQVILASGKGDGQLLLANEDTWRFEENTIMWGPNVIDKPVLSVSLLGRIFSRDGGENKTENDGDGQPAITTNDPSYTWTENNGPLISAVVVTNIVFFVVIIILI